MQNATHRVRGLGLLLLLVGIALPAGALAEQTRAATKPAVDNAPVAAKHVRHTKKHKHDQSAHAQKETRTHEASTR